MSPISPGGATSGMGPIASVGEVMALVRNASNLRRSIRILRTTENQRSGAPSKSHVWEVAIHIAGRVRVDALRRVAHVPAGSTWAEVIEAAKPFGLSPAYGKPVDSVVADIVHGAIGIHGRRHGPVADSVRGMSVVTADGELRSCTRGSNALLFDALRGGGGGFGIVVDVELDLVAVDSILVGSSTWDGEDSFVVASAWLAWSRDAPPETATTLRLATEVVMPKGYARTRSSTVTFSADVIVVRSSDRSAAAKAAGDVVTLLSSQSAPIHVNEWRPAAPTSPTIRATVPTGRISRSDHMLLDDLDDRTLDDLVSVFKNLEFVSEVEFVQLGGRSSAQSRESELISPNRGRLAYAASGTAETATDAITLHQQLRYLRGILSRADTGLTSFRFVTDPNQPHRSVSTSRASQLSEIRYRFDPQGVFAPNVEYTFGAGPEQTWG